MQIAAVKPGPNPPQNLGSAAFREELSPGVLTFLVIFVSQEEEKHGQERKEVLKTNKQTSKTRG